MKSHRRQKFVELATKRVNRAIKDLRLIGNLSNKSAYQFDEEDVRKIVRALQKEIDSIKARFGGPGDSGHNEFTV